MSDYQITLVPPDGVGRVWPAVEPYVAKAVSYTDGRYEAFDVLHLLLTSDYHLWVAFCDDGIKGAVVTRFIDYPRKRYLFLEFCGGVDGFQWKDKMLSVLRDWAKDNDCDGIEASGRDGWKKIFERDGYEPKLRNFELALNER